MAEIIRFCNAENLQKNAAVFIKTALTAYLASNKTAIMAICGGSSVAGIFAKMVDQDLEWGRVHFFMADERLVPIDDPDSNFKLAKDTLFTPLIYSGKLTEANLHPFRTDLDIPEALAKYNEDFQGLGGQISVSLLSAGPDGHIASLFPNHPSVADASEGFIAVDNSPKPPAKRISASRKILEAAASSVLVVAGQSKAEALAKIESGSGAVEDCPARIITGSDRSYVLTDIE